MMIDGFMNIQIQVLNHVVPPSHLYNNGVLYDNPNLTKFFFLHGIKP